MDLFDLLVSVAHRVWMYNRHFGLFQGFQDVAGCCSRLDLISGCFEMDGKVFQMFPEVVFIGTC